MGAYLSAPVTDKISCDAKDEKLGVSYGASSMQGWRNSQEDAHNCVLDFDPETETTLFAVYDGHGGSEVATYCALNLPNFIKTLDLYKAGDLAKALEEGYIKFDELLTREEVINKLKIISGRKDETEGKDEDDPNEMADLHEEATMSIEELILKYSCRSSEKTQQDSSDEGSPTESPGSSKSVSVGEVLMKLYKTSKKKAIKESSDYKATSESSTTADDNPVPEKTQSEGSQEENADSNGQVANGSESNATKEPSEVPFVSAKGKGKGKGLSNSIRKSEKSPEELEKERKVAEKLARAAERKQNLRKRSGEDIYSELAKKETDDEEEELEDDEEDEDFVGDDSSASEAPEADEDDDEDDEEDDEEDVEEEEEDDTAARAVVDRFAQTMKEEPGSDSGCTAVVALVRGNKLYVANAGDSRCVLSRRGRAVSLSSDHKPEDEPERSRIEKAGGAVTADGRVNGGLNLSRAIGDHAYKQNKELGPEEQMITALPDVQVMDLEPGDEFLVLACDGIWNSKTNQEVVDFVSSRIRLNPDKLSQICEELFDECLAPNTLGDGTGCDNMTAIIVRLDRLIDRPRDGEPETSTTDAAVGTGTQKRPLSPEFPAEGSADFRSLEEEGAAAKEKKIKLDGHDHQQTNTDEVDKI